MHPYRKFVNQHLAELLSRINMDKEYVRGQGCWLYDAQGRPYLDMIAAYGALPFGYNPPEIWDSLKQVELDMEPSFVQPSYLNPAGELARLLASVLPSGLTNVTFANSGAEAAEASIKLCRAATGRRGILAAHNSFHGKTLGALSATGKPHYQQVFGAPVEHFDSIPYGDAAALEKALAAKPDFYAAFMIEPIQGEGGIVVPPPGYLRQVRELCSANGVLLVLDEIQTGLGRTGRFLACEEEQVIPDVLLLAKALGGGLFPIGACICREEIYTEDFALKHSSTFAGSTLACRVGIKALQVLLAEDGAIIKNAAHTGQILKSGLLELHEKYPGIINEIRGKGLMLGLQFGVTRRSFPLSMLGVMAEQELLPPAISSYLLNVHGVRMAPTLNGSDVLRIEPPLIITPAQCQIALEALDETVQTLASGNSAHFLGHLIGKKKTAITTKTTKSPASPPDADNNSTIEKFAFLVHPVDIKNYAEFDQSLEEFTNAELEALVHRLNGLVEPFVVSSTLIRSTTGHLIRGDFISVPRTADELLSLPEEQVLAELKAAVQLGISRGARIVGLGAYTSVAARAGRLLLDCGCAITTGNSYTVVAAMEAAALAMEKLGQHPGHTTTAIVGATGAIGKALGILQAENTAQLILLGNPKWPAQSRKRLLRIAGEITAYLVRQAAQGKVFKPGTLGDKIQKHPHKPGHNAPGEEYTAFAELLEGRHGPLTISTQIDKELPQADVVICATSSPQVLVGPHNLKYGALVCDISRPSNVSPAVLTERPDVLVFDGGIIEVPGRPNLGWNFGLEQGLAFACMAETMLLTLEGRFEHTSIGSDLNLETIYILREMAVKHGFRVADLRSFNKNLDQEEWARFLRARRMGDKPVLSLGS